MKNKVLAFIMAGILISGGILTSTKNQKPNKNELDYSSKNSNSIEVCTNGVDGPEPWV